MLYLFYDLMGLLSLHQQNKESMRNDDDSSGSGVEETSSATFSTKIPKRIALRTDPALHLSYDIHGFISP